MRDTDFVQAEIDARWWLERLRAAVGVRRAVRACRESDDGLLSSSCTAKATDCPRTVVDIYGDTAVVQAHSVGMIPFARYSMRCPTRGFTAVPLAAVYDKSAQTLLSYKADMGPATAICRRRLCSRRRLSSKTAIGSHVRLGRRPKDGLLP